ELGLDPEQPARHRLVPRAARASRGRAGAGGPGHRPAARLPGVPHRPRRQPGPRRARRHLLDPLTGVVRRPAGTAGHPDPGPGERGGGADHLLGGPARAQRRRRPAVGAARGQAVRLRRRLQRLGPAAPGRAAAGHAGGLRGPPGGHGLQHRPGHRRGAGRERRPRPTVPPRVQQHLLHPADRRARPHRGARAAGRRPHPAHPTGHPALGQGAARV
ncbi:MAG: ABC transporter, permease protein (cluster 13, osmolytes), partial [uncultured Friedmanniella sp.]